MTTVVNRKQTQAYDVYIGRPTLFGNPFRVGTDGTRDEVIAKFRTWFHAPEQTELRAIVRQHLTGKILGCWCHPKPCHGDVFVEFCDQPASAFPFTCPVHCVPEPCPECQGKIAAGL